MNISYNWLKWYLPDAPEANKLADIITYHLAEVETVEEKDGDSILDVKILPNRAHDLLSHLGMAREIASLLDIKFNDPVPMYKVPTSSMPASLKVEIKSDKVRRYMGRIVKGFNVGPSPEWVVKHLEAIGQRSINNIVDATNLVMYDCGQPTHVFDADKVVGNHLFIAQAEDGESLTLLGGKVTTLDSSILTIRDREAALDVAGVKGGTKAEVDSNTTTLNLSIANFEPVSIRKTAQKLNIFTDARKRFENDLSPELTSYAMTELSALIVEMCPEAQFEDIVDIYPEKQQERTVSFSTKGVSVILGLDVSVKEIENILKRYNISYSEKDGNFEMVVPPLRLDLITEEDMTEEIGRIIGYDRLKLVMPEIKFTPKVNETYEKIRHAHNSLIGQGYREVMTYAFRDKGEVEVLASASDKKFLRTNLSDGLKNAYELNKLNLPLLDNPEVKIFEIGTVFLDSGEEMHVAYGDKKQIKEMTLGEYVSTPGSEFPGPRANSPDHGNSLPGSAPTAFKMWSLYPFISRDIAVWVPEGIKADELKSLYTEFGTELLIKEPVLFDQFTKDGRTSYAFRLVFQSYERTLTDAEVSEIMEKITSKIKAKGWEVR
jgi:phenylalanyl-tRNA synthetase beta chain